MKKEFLEAGKIINTFGIRGELKVQPWSDRVDFLKQFKTIYISGQPVRVVSVRVHQQNALLTLEGVTGTATWKSSNTNVVKVSDKGVVERVGSGTATITITLGSATAEILVRVN